MLRTRVFLLLILGLSCRLVAGEALPVEARLKTPDEKFLPEGDRKPYPDRVILPFWEIGLSEFSVDTPRPIAIPRKAGEPDMYWYWPFEFKAVTSLSYVREALKEVLDNPETREAQRKYYRMQLARVEKTLEVPKQARLYIVIHTDTGQIVPDTSNPAVRNLVERKIHRRMATTSEIARKTLRRGETVRGVAIFPRLDPKARSFEIRVYGLGDRYLPSYEPSKLLHLENQFQKTLRKALRFDYRRLGNANEYLAPVELLHKESGWVWIWQSQIYAGRWRKIEIERNTELQSDAGDPIVLKREYRYIPYKIWNDTHIPQSLDVLKAGLRFSVEWEGISIPIYMPDVGEADDFWKTQVERIWRARATGGEERAFVEQYEKPGAGAGGDVIEKDLAAKADILPEHELRHPRGILDPLEMVRGIMVIRWGVEDIEETVAGLIREIRIRALTTKPDAVKSGLVKAYLDLYPPETLEKDWWMRPAEPSDEKVTQMLMEKAEAALQARGSQPGEDEKRRYGALAPIGHFINLLATDYAAARAEGGKVPWKETPESGNIVDVAFEVSWDNVVDRASFPCNFKRRLPVNLKAYEVPEVSTDYRRSAPGTGLGELEETPVEEPEEKEPAKEEPEKKEPKEDKWDEEELPWG